MPNNPLTVEVYPAAEDIADGTPQIFRDIDFVSQVNHGTFGPPALVAPAPNKDPNLPRNKPTARPGQRVLYVNTSLVPLFIIERNGEDE